VNGVKAGSILIKSLILRGKLIYLINNIYFDGYINNSGTSFLDGRDIY
jgi:hypothetical protein